ncbi:MAG: single-stranded DNA-binding protein [Planctomycetes bacterium]|nr:single-stranded DNA-binding protein [Planctomycetota bacterium]
MASFNKILLMGNLTRDPQLSYTPSQTAVVDFGLATNRRWTAQDGSQRDETCFVDCRAFGRMAENINKFFKKGRPIFVEGRLSFDQWTGQDGVKRSKHRVTVENFTFMPGPGGPGGGSDQPDMGSYDEAGPSGPGRPGGPVPDDDIPF